MGIFYHLVGTDSTVCGSSGLTTFGKAFCFAGRQVMVMANLYNMNKKEQSQKKTGRYLLQQYRRAFVQQDKYKRNLFFATRLYFLELGGRFLLYSSFDVL